MTQPDRRQAIPHEILLEQAGFLRRLARDLMRDPHAAEDAVQDVWVAALEHPPRYERNLHGWLAAVLKNLVSKRSRAHVRRAHHEQEAARTTPRQESPAPAESESSVRFVTDSVLGLDEPYRSTILMRYFEELAVQEIAERQSVPVSTVKSRLQRALELLRERMKRENGSSWSHALVGLVLPAAAAHPGSAASVGTGVLAMTMKTKIAAAAVLVLGAWLLVHEMTGVPGGVPESESKSLEAPALADAGSASTRPLSADAPPPARSPDTSAPPPSAAVPDDRPPTLFYGSLRDRSGKLLAGLWSEGVSLADSTGRWRGAEAADGNFAFGALPYGKYWVLVGADGYRNLEEVIELDASHAQIKRDYTLQEAVELRIRVVTTDGELWFDRKHGVKLPGYPLLLPIGTKERPGRWLAAQGVGTNPNAAFGIGHFTDYGPRVEALAPGYYGILSLTEELPAFVSLATHNLIVQTKEVKPGEKEVEFVVSPDELKGLLAEVRVQVVDADSQAPITGNSLQVGPQCQLPRVGPKSEIVIGSLGAGDFDWEIRAPGYERAFVHFHADPGSTVELGTIALEKELLIEAKVVDPSGAPRSDRLDLCSFDPVTREARIVSRGIPSNGEGVLKLEGLGRRLYLLRSDEYQLIGDRVTTNSMLASGNVILDLRSGRAPMNLVVRLQPVTRLTFTATDLSLKGLPLRVLDEQGIALYSNIVYGEQPRSLALPQGSYRIEVLDATGQPLISKALTLGSSPLSVELSR